MSVFLKDQINMKFLIVALSLLAAAMAQTQQAQKDGIKVRLFVRSSSTIQTFFLGKTLWIWLWISSVWKWLQLP